MAKGKYQQWLEPDSLIKLEGWARDGLTDEQIAHNMGINVSTLYVWKDIQLVVKLEHPNLLLENLRKVMLLLSWL